MPFFGPYKGDLSNSGERISLEKAQASDDLLDPDNPSWIIVDEVAWLDEAPWPADAEASGLPLLRVRSAGNDPHSWSLLPDFDRDELPDAWERIYRQQLSDLGSGNFDQDHHTDREEYIAGTDPADADSFLNLSNDPLTGHGMIFSWDSIAGRVYNVFWSSNLLASPVPVSGDLNFPRNSYTDETYRVENSGFYLIDVRQTLKP